MARTVIEHAAVATVDSRGTEFHSGHVVIEDGWITTAGNGPAPEIGEAERIDGTGCLLTPGLVNTHHHLYQWATRGMAADATLFEWLTALYPVWAGLDAEITHAAASAGLGRLAVTGCSTVADHHYVFPSSGGDQMRALVSAVHRIGLRGHLVRGSMDRGESDGGLPPDNLVESTEQALLGTERAIDEHHDPAVDARIRIAAGPCSPFTVSRELMSKAAELARRKGVRLHTHLAETLDEHEQCRHEFGCTPAEYADDLGWLARDVWLAHTVHLAPDAIRRFATTGTSSAHCPSSNGRLGTGTAPVADLLAAGVPVGLGVDGAASNESGGLAEEMRTALQQARQRGGPKAMAVRDALWMATMGGARCLGRQDELGSIEPGKLADLALWRLDGLEHAGIEDPVAALVLGTPPPLQHLLVGGRSVVAGGELRSTDQAGLARELLTASTSLRS